ncbi:unnamed protein product [Prorocentrum cordatum]|uniref:RNA-directed RNA polymerase n=1 Tax=Prorocentrum cordatum TaxID=2364126 RepID=A0ABN9RSV9_9DINO|nr:unnamed protein product [Polarella glacialis]
MRRAKYHTAYEFGWERGRYTNKSAGCTVLLRSRVFRRCHVVDIRHPPGELAGRGGLVRVRSGVFDIAIIAAYFPPQSNMTADHWRQCCRKLAGWMHKSVQEAKQRSLVIVGADCNCGFGLRRTGHGIATTTVGHQHIGQYGNHFENEVPLELWRLLEMENMAAVDTFHPVGPTYFGTQSQSSPDHIFVPSEAVSSTVRCCALRNAMRDLQAIPDCRPRDHAPLLWQVRYTLQAPPGPKGGPVWDKDLVVRLLRHDGFGAEVLGELERRSASHPREWERDTTRADPSHSWEKLVEDVRAAALPELARTAKHGPLAPHLAARAEALQRRRLARRGCFTEEQRHQLRTIEKDIKLLKKRLDLEHVEELLTEAETHRYAADYHGVWKLIYAIGARCRGPRQRSFNVPDQYRPSLEEWASTMCSNAREGGFSATVIDDPMQPTREAMEGNTKKGTKAMRLIHCYCPFAKAWYRGLYLRHEEAVMEIRAGEQVGYFQPKHGTGMGDGNACELFVRSFLRPVEAWRDELGADEATVFCSKLNAQVPLHRASCVMTCSLTNEMHGVSVRDYADDIHQTIPLATSNPLEARSRVPKSNAILDRELSIGGGFAQNPDKENCMPVMVGPGAHTASRALLSQTVPLPGVTSSEGLYLGGMEQLTAGCGAEMKRRVEATRAAWGRLGRFWDITRSIRLKRLAFKGTILAAAYSGLESYLPSKLDLRKLDSVVLGFARVVLRDRRPEFEQGAPPGSCPKYRSLSEAQVLRQLRITDSRAELLVRRLRQWQRFARYPEDSAQPLTVLFGSLDGLGEEPTFREDGRVASTANPWALQLERDVQALRYLRGGKEFAENYTVRDIFTRFQSSVDPLVEPKVPVLAPQRILMSLFANYLEMGRMGGPAAETEAEAHGGDLGGVANALSQLFQNADQTYGLQRGDVMGLGDEAFPVELIQAIFPVMVRAMLKNIQGLSALEAAIYHIIHLDRDHDVCKAMRITAKFYVDEANRSRREHAQEIRDQQPVEDLEKLGVPHPHLWLALVGGVVQQGERVGAANHLALKQYLDTIKADGTITNDSLCMQIRHCKISYTHDRKLMKIHLEAQGSGVQTQLLDSLKQLGGKLMKGTPPRSHHERLMQLFLDSAETI